jgi:TonB-linked SusC/RagA family outer membrane protein
MDQLNRFKKCKTLLLGAMFILFCSSAWSQVNVTGTVVSGTDKQPLIGATVLVKGTSNGTTTDIKGKFSLKIDNPADAVLAVTFMGYLPEEVSVQGRSVVDVELIEDVKQLDEVVVIGYGTVKKKDLTGSVTSIKSSEIASAKAPNALEALQGRAAGIDLTQADGQAGATLNINLRGTRSLLASNDPLILVDGVEYGNTLDINTSDIESIDVLKDASSTAIYGTRGANGVIIITTKKGGKGKSKVNFSAYSSYNVPTFIPRIANSQEYVQKRIETLIADNEQNTYTAMGVGYSGGMVTWNQTANPTPWTVFGTVTQQQLMDAKGYTSPYQLITADPTALDLLNKGVSLNYMDLIFHNSFTDNYELGVSGGNDKTAISLSLGLMNDRGLLRNDFLRRYNFRIGIDHKMYKNLKVGSNILFTYKRNLKRDNGIFTQALKTGPIGILYNADGTYNQYPDKEFTNNQPNPMLDEAPGAYLNEIRTNRLFGSVYVSWDIIPGLTIKSNIGVDVNGNRNGLYQGPTSLRQLVAATALTQMQNTSYWSYTWDNTLNYSKKFGKHEIQGLLGSSATANATEFYQMIGLGQQTSATQFYDWSGFSTATPSSTYTASQMLSYFGRINYNFSDKYLLTASLRTDGSSVLSPGKKWGYFPSTALAWRINQENFLKNVQWLSDLKARVAWGISGNAAVKPYQTVTQLSSTPIYYTFDNAVYSSLPPLNMGNTDVKWETTTTWNAGLDFGFFNRRITGSVDFYLANTTDALFYLPLPGTSVYPQVIANVASTRNKGIEVSLNTVNIKTKDFEWNTVWNLTANRDEIVKLNSGANQVIYGSSSTNQNQIWRVGAPINSYFDYYKQGIYQISDLKAEYMYVQQQQANGQPIDPGKIPMINNKFMPGDIKIRDVNGDGKFTDADKVLYNRSPKASFGINNNFSYKNLGLSVMLYGRIGQKLQYGLYQNYKPANLFVENGPYVNAWTPANTGGDFPRYYTNGNGKSNLNSSLTYLDGSYVKINDITLSYNLPKKLMNKIRIANLKLYATGKNLFTFSKIDNYDPEVGGTMNFPLAKQYIVGLNLDF